METSDHCCLQAKSRSQTKGRTSQLLVNMLLEGLKKSGVWEGAPVPWRTRLAWETLLGEELKAPLGPGPGPPLQSACGETCPEAEDTKRVFP